MPVGKKGLLGGELHTGEECGMLAGQDEGARGWGYTQGVRMDGCKGDEGRERRGADAAEPPDGGRDEDGACPRWSSALPALSDSAAAHSQRGAR